MSLFDFLLCRVCRVKINPLLREPNLMMIDGVCHKCKAEEQND